MDTYIALKDCYHNGFYLKRGQTVKVPKGTKVEFKLLKLVEDEAAEKKASGK